MQQQMPTPPREGSVTLVFTRLDNPDGLWRQLGERTRPLISAHDAIVRRHLSPNGYEVKREGAGFLYAFADAAAALRAVVGIQDALADLSVSSESRASRDVPLLRVAIGVHTGQIIARQDVVTGRLDYLGTTANLAARVAQAAAGEQILLSRDTLVAAMEAGYPVDSPEVEGAWIGPRGTHRLRGLSAMVQLLELRPRRLLSRPMMPVATEQSLTDVGTIANLPSAMDPIFGRDGMLLALGTALAEGARWLTLVGPPGVGKTRLASELARWALSGLEGRSFYGGVWWLDLPTARSVADVVPLLAQATRVSLLKGDTEVQLASALSARGDMLLVFDRAEALHGELPELLDRLLRLAPGVSVVVTSRVALDRAGERTVTVPPLPCPPADAGPEALLGNPAVRLILEQFRLHADKRALLERAALHQLGELVRLLDGLPEAILQATGGLVSNSAVQVVGAALDWARSGKIGFGPRDSDVVRASMGRSWALLDERVQRALVALTVFRGPFTVPEAERVIPPGELGALDLLQRALDHNLLARREAASGLFFLPRPVLTFCEEQRAWSGPVAVVAEQAHAALFAEVGASARLAALGTPRGGALVETLSSSRENLGVALARARSRKDLPTERAIRAALMALAEAQGPASLALHLFPAEDAAPMTEPQDYAAAADAVALLTSAGLLADAHRVASQAMAALGREGLAAHRARLLAEVATLMYQRDAGGKALTVARSALQLARGADDASAVIAALTGLAALLVATGQAAQAAPLAEEAVAVASAQSDLRLAGKARLELGLVLSALGRPAEALITLQGALALTARLGQRRLRHTISLATATPLLRLGRDEEAEKLLRALLPELYATGDLAQLAAASALLGDTLMAALRPDQALPVFEDAVSAQRALGSRGGLLLASLRMGECLLALDQAELAGQRLTEAASLNVDADDPLIKARIQAGLGEANARLGRGVAAAQGFARAEEILRRAEDRRGLLDLLLRRGPLQRRLEDAARDLVGAEALIAALPVESDPALRNRLETFRSQLMLQRNMNSRPAT